MSTPNRDTQFIRMIILSESKRFLFGLLCLFLIIIIIYPSINAAQLTHEYWTNVMLSHNTLVVLCDNSIIQQVKNVVNQRVANGIEEF